MKKSSFLAFLLSVCANAMAADYDYLIIKQTDGTETALSAAPLKITFADGNLLATSPNGITTLPLSSLSSMYFSTTATNGIEALQAIGEAQAATVTSMTGVVVARGESVTDATRRLAPGLYIVKTNKDTKKILVK